MKLLRVGELGSEIVATIYGNNVIMDLSDHIKDLNLLRQLMKKPKIN